MTAVDPGSVTAGDAASPRRIVVLRHALTQSLPDTWAVDVCNDAFAFASAELVDRDAPRLNLLMVLLAEGVGSAYVADGHLVTGGHGFAGELGHMQIFAQGRVDRFEAFAGIAGFDQGAGQGMPVAEAVAALIAAKDHPDTKAALDRWAGALCVGLANAAHLLDPDRIVLGGPLSALYPLVCAKVEAGLAALMLQGHASPTLHLARFGAEGAAIGAAARLRARLFALPDLDQPRLAQSA